MNKKSSRRYSRRLRLFVLPLDIRHTKQCIKFEVSLAQVVLKICSLVCEKLQGSRDLDHAHFWGNLFVRPLGIPNTKPPTKLEVSSSSRFGDIDAAMVDMTWNDL